MSEKPRLFIASSTEAIKIADFIEERLKNVADVITWKSAFDLGDVTIDTLFHELDYSDYAVLIAIADDKVITRTIQQDVPRDNIIFEVGLFMGRLGRKCAFVVCDRNIKLPSDLSGVTIANFNSDAYIIEDSLEDAVNKVKSSVSNSKGYKEFDFLRSYFAFIEPGRVKLGDTYSDILGGQIERIKQELDRLISQKDWSKILRLKKLLRDYFEYSGNYDKGASFGEVYVHALKELKTLDEEAWSRIKDIGYMHILAGRHKKGRDEIEKALRLVDKLDNHDENKAALFFYAYRYLSISYHRDNVLKDIKKSSYYLDLARKQLPHIKNHDLRKELKAKYYRNLAHLELERKNFDKSIRHYRSSLSLFEEIEDVEHIGATHLAIAKALIAQASDFKEDPLSHLRDAERMFASIGWIEGQARVLEQRARHYVGIAKREDNLRIAKMLLGEAKSALDNSQIMFNRIHLVSFTERLEALTEEIHQIEESWTTVRL